MTDATTRPDPAPSPEPGIGERGMPTAQLRRRIEWSDTDASGHHHNSVVWRLVEGAEAALMRERGIVDEYFWSAPRVRQEVDYENKLYFGQEVTAIVEVERVGGSSLTVRFEVWGEAFGDQPRRRAASGRFVSAHVAQGTERATPWPDHIREALQG